MVHNEADARLEQQPKGYGNRQAAGNPTEAGADPCFPRSNNSSFSSRSHERVNVPGHQSEAVIMRTTS